MTSIRQVRPLLDFIAKYESRGNYDAIWGGIRNRDRPPKALTQMTVQEVLNWQDSIDHHYMSEASGRYQILEDTLRGLYREAGVRRTDIFDEVTQDRLALQLLKRRGLVDYLEGRMRVSTFANSLAKEWASLPVVTGPNKGRSYYAGDGLNKAHADVDPFLLAVRQLLVRAEDTAAPAEPDRPKGLLARLAELIENLLEGWNR